MFAIGEAPVWRRMKVLNKKDQVGQSAMPGEHQPRRLHGWLWLAVWTSISRSQRDWPKNLLRSSQFASPQRCSLRQPGRWCELSCWKYWEFCNPAGHFGIFQTVDRCITGRANLNHAQVFVPQKCRLAQVCEEWSGHWEEPPEAANFCKVYLATALSLQTDLTNEALETGGIRSPKVYADKMFQMNMHSIGMDNDGHGFRNVLLRSMGFHICPPALMGCLWRLQLDAYSIVQQCLRSFHLSFWNKGLGINMDQYLLFLPSLIIVWYRKINQTISWIILAYLGD